MSSDEGRGRKGGINGLLGGLNELVERFKELAEKGETLSRSGTLGEDNRGVRGVYGLSVKFGLGGDDKPTVEPFGNIRPDEQTGESRIHEVREPLTDLFEEEDHLLVVAEMPGVAESDLTVEIDGDLLTLQATRGDIRYRKELLLPRPMTTEGVQVSCNNGLVNIRLEG